MKKFLLWAGIALLATLVCAAANAADIKRPAEQQVYTKSQAPLPYSWSGLYLTGYGTYGINITNMATQSTVNSGGGGATTPISIDLASDPHGPGFGGALSALYQLPNSPWVIGARAELGWANLQGSGAAVSGNVLSVSNATNYLGSINGILGYALGADQKLLAYLTGGLAGVGAKPNLQVGSLSQGLSDTSFGWDFGGGLAYAVTPNFDVFIEGDYFDAPGKSLALPGIGSRSPAIVTTSSAQYKIVEQKVGISIKFP